MEVLEGETLEGFTPTDGTVLALTMQMLASIRASRADVYAELKRAVSLILVDEGHYEPALEWSQAIRELGAPTFVFTATPYRNDFKSFNVDAQHMSVLSYDQCVTDRLLRSVEFKSIDSAESPDEFVARLVVEIDRLRPRLPDDFRVVVRCKDANSIRGVCRALSTQTTDGVVGIHERFSDKPESWERRHVPDCAKETAVYWVHQHKLLEGIDDDRFHVVAIHGALGSARALVQQVGRVVRNPGLKESVAYVLDGSGGSHILMWDRFLAYDSAASSVERVIDIMNASENFVSSLAAATPAHVYSEGRFRTGLNLDQFDPTLDLQVPLTATWLEKKPSFDLDQFADCLVKEFRAKDHEAHAYGMDGWRVVMAYGASNSALLANQVFLEPRLRAVIIREYDSLVAAQGADAVLITHADKLGVGDPIGTSRLERLFDVSARLTSVSLSNSNLSPVSIRSRTLSASSIGETLAGFDDYSQICTRAEGYAASNRKRNNRAWKYVGFSRGRVSERSTYLPFGEYLDWLDSIASTLDSATASVPVFKRYAPGTGVPTKTDAQSLLLDMSSIGLDFVLSVDGETPLELTDTCLAVKSGKFELKANGESVEGTIAFDTARSKYRIDSPALASKYVTKSSDGIDNLVDRVNAEQSLQVLPVSPDRFYAYGSFFDPRIKIGSRYDKNSDPVTFCLHPVTNLENYAEEKGKSD
ncbi:MAG: hypothetical protein Q8M66_07200, partial [Actinomycetota bacterium]|nr:hypothetical protein [Actinomycetota bacterium]